jgi:hypothetical protein
LALLVLVGPILNLADGKTDARDMPLMAKNYGNKDS